MIAATSNDLDVIPLTRDDRRAVVGVNAWKDPSIHAERSVGLNREGKLEPASLADTVTCLARFAGFVE